jgi:hypothetical protein
MFSFLSWFIWRLIFTAELSRLGGDKLTKSWRIANNFRNEIGKQSARKTVKHLVAYRDKYGIKPR